VNELQNLCHFQEANSFNGLNYIQGVQLKLQTLNVILQALHKNWKKREYIVIYVLYSRDTEQLAGIQSHLNELHMRRFGVGWMRGVQDFFFVQWHLVRCYSTRLA
jgi:hypothetical protein